MLLGEALPSCYRWGSAAHSDPHTVLVFLPVPDYSLWVNGKSDGLYTPDAKVTKADNFVRDRSIFSFPIDFPCQKLGCRAQSDFKSLQFI